MAIKAFVLIEMKTDHINANVVELKKKPHINSVYSVAGPYDVIGIIDTEDYKEISKIVAEEIHSLPGILKTTTLLAFE
jgi:DNA-binding Lrp family transcriptional regulator